SGEQLATVSTIDDLQKLLAEGGDRPQLPSYAHLARPYTLTLPARLRRLGRSATRLSLTTTFEHWLKPRILGAGNVPANRASHVDFGLVMYALGAQGHDLVVLAAKDYFFNTGMRRFLATNFTSLIPFDRERAQIDSLEEALAQLRAGQSVLMFPEGTRSPDGAIHEFKSGAGYLALHSGCDVLPIRISGTHEVLGKGSLLPRRRPVEIRIGAPISAADLIRVAGDVEGPGIYRRTAEYLHDAVVALTERPPRRLRATTSSTTPRTSAPPVDRKRRADRQAKG